MSSDFPNRSGGDSGKGQGSGAREGTALYLFTAAWLKLPKALLTR